MEIPAFARLAYQRFVLSSRYEDDLDFRTIMGHHVNRGVGLIGGLGLAVLVIYVISQVFILGKSPVWRYGLAPTVEATVLWDKVVIALILASALALRLSRKTSDPLSGRMVASAGAVIVTVAIVLDDVAAGNVSFSPAYVTIVLLTTTTAVSFKPISSLLLSAGVVIVWYVCVEQIPSLIGLEAQTAPAAHAVYLILIVVLATGEAAVMYENRFAQFKALRQEQQMVAQLAETNRILNETMHALTDAQDRMIHSEKMASLGRFATGIAHELRNPLNFTLNFSKLSSELADELMEGSTDSGDGLDRLVDLKSNLGFVLKHAQRAENIVGELVAQSDRTPAIPKVTDLNDLIRAQVAAVVGQYGDTSDGASIEITESYDSTVGSIELLRASFAHAVRNILNNAFQAVTEGREPTAEEGSVVNGGVIAISTKRTQNYAEVCVRDNGPGIDEDATEHVFEPFFTTRAAGSGTGLGLTIAYEVITDGHGGRIQLDSRKGEGTTVRIEIPVGK